MSRFEQRLREDLQDRDFAEGFNEADAELVLLEALENARRRRHVSKSELAFRMGRQRESISRILSLRGANPTLRTIIMVLSSLDMTAEITLRPSTDGEEPITIAAVV
ncbi:MAG TPA: hypothetical protein VFV38_05955 [Ktedonobacteraceae bacterium]|nr:hypothetical protein [Ktedonobacteraceae bacterium]